MTPAAKTQPALPAEMAPPRMLADDESRQHATLAEAMVAAQAEMPAVEKDAVNPHFRSKFTSLDHLIARTRPVLNRHGLSISQWPTGATIAGELVHALRTTITHVSGESDSSVMPLIIGKNDMQGLGGAITYAKRYAWAAALGISTDEDDDGNLASRPEVRQEPAGAPRTRTQPKDDPAPAPASADDLAAYEAEVKAAGSEWPPVLEKLMEAGPVTAERLAAHRAKLQDHLAKVAAASAV